MVAVPPALLRALVITFLALVLVYLLVRFLHGGKVSPEDRVYVPPSVSATVSPSATPAPSTAADPTAPVVPPVATPASSVVTGTDPAAALSAWYDASGQPIIADLQALVPVVQGHADATDYAGLDQDCTDLAGISADARSHRPPGAEAEIAADWDDAADYAADAASECQTAAATEDTSMLASALSTSRQALAAMQDVVAAINTIL